MRDEDLTLITWWIRRPSRTSHLFTVVASTVTVQANFSYQASFGSKGPVAYETLLLDSMRGDATLFTRRDEVEAEWRIISPIEEAWTHLPAPEFPNYAAGNEGPTSWHELLEIRGNSGR